MYVKWASDVPDVTRHVLGSTARRKPRYRLLFGGEGHAKLLPLHLLAKLETFVTFFSAIILQALPNPRHPHLQTVVRHYIPQNG